MARCVTYIALIAKVTFLMGARKNECKISQNYILHMKYFTCVITILVKFDINFPRLS